MDGFSTHQGNNDTAVNGQDYGQYNQLLADDIEKKNISMDKTELKRSLTLFNVVALMISITGHVAIFMTPGSIMALSGSVAVTIVVWFVGGFFVYTLALCFAELGTVFQRAGGPYLYIALTFGPLCGFLIAWGYIILISGPFLSWASYTAAIYIVKALVNDDSCVNKDHKTATQFLAALIIVTLMYFNCRHFKFVMRIQSALTCIKMVTIVIIILLGIYMASTDSSETFEEPLKDSTFDPGRLALAILVVVFSNGGWQSVTSLTEEVQNPSRTLPLAIHLTFAFSVGVNFLTFMSYMIALEVADIKGSDTIALLFWQRIWPSFIPVVSAAVALACVGALNTGMIGHSRVLMAAARQGVMPGILSTLNPTHQTPMVALFTVTAYGLLMLVVGSPSKMIQFVGLFSFIMGFFIAVAVIYLRISQPNLPRPYKAPLLFPAMQVFVNLCMLVLVIYQEPEWMMIGVVIFLAGVPIYLFACSPKPKKFLMYTGKMTALIQKCFVQVPIE